MLLIIKFSNEVVSLLRYIKPDKHKLKGIEQYKSLHRFACRLLLENFGLLGIKQTDNAVFLLSLFTGLEADKNDYKSRIYR